MDKDRYKAAIERTAVKLRFSAILLNELKTVERRGSDFERSHQESFLFHLHGVRDAFLQEINIKLDCGLSIEKVGMQSLKRKIAQLGLISAARDKLEEIESDENSWLSHLNEMRHHSTHRHNVPRLYHMGGEKHGEVHLGNTKNGEFVDEDYVVLFGQWHSKMNHLITQLRSL